MGFSFGAGNAAKLARIPLYALARVATVCIPRTRDRWVFGCGVGIGDGALALWERVAHDGRPAVWLTGGERDAADAEARGIPHLPKHSWRGFWATARARVVVVTHGFGDVNRYAIARAFVVQLWHGIPLKRIGLDSPETVRSAFLPESRILRRILARLYAGTTSQISLLPAASHLVRGRLESAFALDDARIPVTGEPRVDVLSQDTADARNDRARAIVVAATGALPTADTRLVLYAPTWRDGRPDPAVPAPEDWGRILAVLDATDTVLLVRSHPLGAGEYRPSSPTERVRSLNSDIVLDATPVLPALAALVTDYSSMVFDAALVDVPVVFLAPDEDDYARTRGFYGRYADVAGDAPARDWGAAVRDLEAVLTDPEVRAAAVSRAGDLSRRVHAYRDGRNTDRVYRDILDRAGLLPADAHRARRNA